MTGVNTFQKALLPPLCLLCGAAGTDHRDLCAGCAGDLPLNSPACRCCALPLLAEQGPICGHCLSRPPSFDHAFAPFLYKSPVDYLIVGLKFNHRLSHARLLGELLAEALVARREAPPDCIVPVPLHPRRLRERGFNQALELCRAPARRFQIPLLGEGLKRIRHTTPQTKLNAQQRRTNLVKAFILSDPLKGKRVALVDDVITTASTVTECARVLRAGGAAEIEIWAIARAVDCAI
ncbi:MAG: ComF family protein [Candidatus Competibacteraceae bacterium]|nr:ComF family protein [Candidatus Competibacteraceae bacterium]